MANTGPQTAQTARGVANAVRPELLGSSGRYIPARGTAIRARNHNNPVQTSAPTDAATKEGAATAHPDNRTVSHSTDPRSGDRMSLHVVLPQSIAAPAPNARPSAPDTPEIDRSSCPASGKPTRSRGGRPLRLHGTASAAVRHGCTCPDAELDARRMWKRNRMRRRLPSRTVPAIGVSRRIQGMARAGFGAPAVAAEVGVHPSRIDQLRRMTCDHVDIDTYRRIVAVTDRLRHRQPPQDTVSQRIAATRVRRYAENAGWAPLDAWDGVDIDDPAAESDLAYARTDDDGPTAADLLDLLDNGLTLDQVAARFALDPADAERRIQYARITLGRSAITDQDAYDIRDRWRRARALGERDPRHELAAEYSISSAAVLNILVGRARPHLRLTDLIGDTAYRHNARRRAS